MHSLSALPAGEHTTTARSAGIAAGDVLLSAGDVSVAGFELAQAVTTLDAVRRRTAFQVRFRRAPGAAAAGAGAAGAVALQTPGAGAAGAGAARGEAAEPTGIVPEEIEPEEVDLEVKGNGDPGKVLERVTALAQTRMSWPRLGGWARVSSTRRRCS